MQQRRAIEVWNNDGDEGEQVRCAHSWQWSVRSSQLAENRKLAVAAVAAD